MASIFTYDPDPPRVSSPWLKCEKVSQKGTPISKPGLKGRVSSGLSEPGISLSATTGSTPPPGLLSDYNITKLEPEPQTGPAEYKLHLLLRPRRKYTSFSTGTQTAAPPQSKAHEAVTAGSPASISRQNRLTQLTTQLLWRLQQSSPYHASATSDLILPQLPEATTVLNAPPRPAKLYSGLESSRGAIYEIGVSDNGDLVGLVEDEMEESLMNLRAMAASLGCVVEVTRMLEVGDCEWHQKSNAMDNLGDEIETLTILDGTTNGSSGSQIRQAKLYVAEALVTPDLRSARQGSLHIQDAQAEIAGTPPLETSTKAMLSETSGTEQLRITLTGPTTCGKSSLLGTLSTATLDNGRGKSRLSLLKHRHELVSGVTSSVAQELLGYCFPDGPDGVPKVINYSSGNVTTWTDIHAQSEHGRLVFVSDGAGHPRFRRTTVRGLVGWAPHWTVLCIAADNGANAPHEDGGSYSAQEVLGGIATGVDLLQAHLELCLKLRTPLIINITKMDLASSKSLRETLGKILTAIKDTGRIPGMLPPDQTKNIVDADLETILDSDATLVRKLLSSIDPDDLTKIVPIIMTSAAKGTGIRMLHSLLSTLPVPRTPKATDYIGDVLNPEQPVCLFHVEDTFTLPAAHSLQTFRTKDHSDAGTVVAGYLRFGSLSVGDKIVVGPFPAESQLGSDDGFDLSSPSSSHSPGVGPKRGEGSEESDHASHRESRRTSTYPSGSDLARLAQMNAARYAPHHGEWHTATVVSLRNLRLPVHTLNAGQVGTLGLVIDHPAEEEVDEQDADSLFERATPSMPRLRKGMVLAIPSKHMDDTGAGLQATSRFTASFEDGDVNSVSPGALVVVYIASIRASARVVRLAPHVTGSPIGETVDEVFGDVDENEEEEQNPVFGQDGVTDVTLELMTAREWIELGSQVLMMPGGGQGLYYGSERGEKGVAGLEGFVGKVIEVVD